MGWGLRAALTLVALLGAPATASAAPPNDDFANAQALSGPLPIEEPGSNEGAKSEPGEPLAGSETGRSVWFEWTAPSEGWYTIGACDSNFAASVGIFTGTEVGNLTRVVAGPGAEGPDCADQRQYTFHATAATHYVIRVDGESIPTPEGPPPPVEGRFTLRIENTPPPSNDDFANATVLEAPVSEEPGGARFFAVFSRGYNWDATTEPGEFPYGANSGASVWYRWTPPESAKYRFSRSCCGEGLDIALFSGGFGIEDEMLAAAGSAEVALSGGTTYWISVYGSPQLGLSEPTMANFGLFVTAELPPLAVAQQPPPNTGSSGPGRDTTPPETEIDKSTLRIAPRTATFWFSASEAAQGFQCRLDKGEFKPCGSPRTYRRLQRGRHTFRVKAVDLAGNVDGSPAVAHFRVPRPYKGRR